MVLLAFLKTGSSNMLTEAAYPSVFMEIFHVLQTFYTLLLYSFQVYVSKIISCIFMSFPLDL